MSSKHIQSHLWLHLVVFIYGFTAVLGKLISISAIPLVWCRLALAVAGLYPLLVLSKTPLRLPPKSVAVFLATGFIVAFHWIAFFASIKASTASIALVCLSSAPLFTALIEPALFKRPFRFYELVLGLAVVAGLLVIFQFEPGYHWGIAWGLLAALLAALFNVINGRLIRDHNPVSISFYELLGGWAAVSMLVPIYPAVFEDLRTVNASDLFFLLILAWLCTAFAFVIGIRVMKELSPFTNMLTTNLEPVYGIVLALIVFGESERMSRQFYLGASIILLTIAANAMIKRKSRSPLAAQS